MAMVGMIVLCPETTSLCYAAKLPPPARYVAFDDPDVVNEHSQLVETVERKIELQRALQDADTPARKAHYSREILAADLEIKRALQALYGLPGARVES